jgi:hypothetical protein
MAKAAVKKIRPVEVKSASAEVRETRPRPLATQGFRDSQWVPPHVVDAIVEQVRRRLAAAGIHQRPESWLGVHVVLSYLEVMQHPRALEQDPLVIKRIVDGIWREQRQRGRSRTANRAKMEEKLRRLDRVCELYHQHRRDEDSIGDVVNKIRIELVKENYKGRKGKDKKEDYEPITRNNIDRITRDTIERDLQELRDLGCVPRNHWHPYKASEWQGRPKPSEAFADKVAREAEETLKRDLREQKEG